MMLIIGEAENLVLHDLSRRTLYAIWDLIHEPVAKVIGHNDWWEFQDDAIASLKSLSLDELPENSFNLACQLILSSQDDLIKPYISDLKQLFKIDPRFQAA